MDGKIALQILLCLVRSTIVTGPLQLLMYITEISYSRWRSAREPSYTVAYLTDAVRYTTVAGGRRPSVTVVYQ